MYLKGISWFPTPNGKGGNPVPTKACLRLFPPGMSKSAAAFGPCCCSTWPNGMALLLNSSFLAKEYKKDAYGRPSPFILAHLQLKTISALGRTKVSLNLTHAARS